jgi:hypothetical protein
MSLQIAANHLASKGRGPDTQLVHMAPNEVAGLQALAKAHGGSLTINPETGLAEAGFLSNILPTVIGAGLMASGVGSPLAIGLMTGAAGTLISGDLKKGLMAGLGAYGGAGMMGSVLGAGAGAAMEAAPLAGGIDGTTAAMQGGFGAGAEQLGSVAGQGAAAATPAQVTGIPGFGGSSVGLTPPPSFTPPVAAVPTPSPAPVTQMPVDYAARNQAMADAAKQQMGINDASFADKLASAPDRIGKGISGIMQNPSQLMTGENLRYGLAAAAPALMATPQQAGYTPDTEQSKFTYSPGRVQNPEEGYTGHATGERTYFRPAYTRLADGGPVGAMSDRNEQLTLLANGGQQFADGGTVDYEFDPVTRQYKKKEAAAPIGAVAPIMATTTSGGISAGLDPRTAAFLDAETPAARDARMQNVSNIIGMLAPGSMINAAAQGIGALVGNQAQPYGGVPVVNMGSDTGFGGYGGIDGTGAAMTAADADAAYSADSYSGGDSGGEGNAAGGPIGYAKGTFLRGPGDGVSDSIPATINGKQPARLADGEFVVPARIVSELGNGSSEAGARKLYAMMDRIQKARANTVGKDKVAKDSKAEKMLPA